MHDPLADIQDKAVRDAIEIFQTYIESALGNLLDPDVTKALAQIESACRTAIQNVKALGSDAVPIDEEARMLRIAIALWRARSTGCAKSTYQVRASNELAKLTKP